MPHLTYLFECHLNDGTSINQTPEDISLTIPTKSAFYDVAQRLDDVIYFGLYNEEHTYVVDLRDGHFEIDGVPFFVNSKHNKDTQDEISKNSQFKLIYWRQVSQTTIDGIPEEPVIEAYIIGWQTTIDGKNYQHTISIK